MYHFPPGGIAVCNIILANVKLPALSCGSEGWGRRHGLND